MLLPLSFKHTVIFPGLSDFLFTWCLRTAFFQIGDFWCKLFAKASLILVEPHANILPDIWILLLKSHVREWTALHILTTGKHSSRMYPFLIFRCKVCLWYCWEPLHVWYVNLLRTPAAEIAQICYSSTAWISPCRKLIVQYFQLRVERYPSTLEWSLGY